MRCSVDLRFALPPLINLLFLLPNSLDGNFSLSENASNLDEYPVLKRTVLILIVVSLVVFLLTSIKLPITLHPVTLRAGCFSVSLTLLLLASILLSPPLFWFVNFVILITFPWRQMIWALQKRIFNRFYHSLQSLPPLFITCTQQHENPTEEATPEAADDEFLDIEANSIA